MCCLLAIAHLAAAADDSTIETLDHAQVAMSHALNQAMIATPGKQDLLADSFNFYSHNSIEVCAPDFRGRQSRPDLPPIDLQSWLTTQPDKWRCIVHRLQEGTTLFNRVTAEAKAGGVSPDTLKALALATPSKPLPAKKAASSALPAVSASVNPWNGTDAKFEHAGGDVFLSYTDEAGAQHRYAVARPKMLQGMATGDTGSWAYVAPDKSSGRIFQVGAGGNVQSSALSAMQIKLFLGQ